MEQVKTIKIQRFTDLTVWQKAHRLVLLTYRLTSDFPRTETYTLVDQMRRGEGMKRIGQIGLIGLIGLMSPMAALAQTYTSSNYQLKNVNFGQETTLFSTDFSPPTISGEGPEVKSVSSNQAVIKWTTNKEGNSVIAYGKTSGTYDYEVGITGKYTTSHEVTVPGLDAETKYYYIAKSTDRLGNLGTSSEKNFTTRKAAKISEVAVSDITLESAIISFKSETVANAVLKYGKTDSYGSTKTETSGSYTTEHNVKLTSLDQGTAYYFKVVGTDEANNTTESDKYVFNTLPLPTISNIKVTDVTANSVTVTWTTNTETDSLVEYSSTANVELQGVAKGETQSAGDKTLTKSHSVKVAPLLGNTTYSFTISVSDSHGNSAKSDLQAFKTAPDMVAPTIVKVKIDSQGLPADGAGKAQTIITWETNELSTTQVKYGLGAKPMADDKLSEENKAYTTSHYIILQGLTPSSTYHIQAISKDLAGNEAASDILTVLTPKKKRSLMQVVVEHLDTIFGWVKNIKIFR